MINRGINRTGFLSVHSMIAALALILSACSKKNSTPSVPQAPILKNIYIDNLATGNSTMYNVNVQPVIRISFTEPIKQSSVQAGVTLVNSTGVNYVLNISLQNGDSVIQVQPSVSLTFLTEFTIAINNSLESASGGKLYTPASRTFITKIDLTPKFPLITDDSLLTLVQKQTFKYFWDFGHPVSGMARERNTSGDVVTTGGTGFGIMAIPVAVNRGFITRAEAVTRIQKITDFLTNTAAHFHGAFSHWMNGATGAVVPFGNNDDGADLVETSYMMMGLLTARQYFDGAATEEVNLRSAINNLWNAVEWDWFRQNGKNVLYWNWSPNSGWAVNVPVQGWNECLITYVLAASSTTHPVTKPVYDSGYARNGAMINGNSYYGYTLPLGPEKGGPLFFEQYSFLGINPTGLSDGYASYETQTKNHSLINYNYCKVNPGGWYGYGDSCWGLTASDIPGGYTASSPTNDVGVIAPTAAISSLPYTPVESMKALKYFYYVLGDKIWKDYGFVDAFKLQDLWYASSFLAIDQGPVIGMIENYRTGLLWNLFTSCPEVKNGMKNVLGFSAPYLL